LKCGLQGCIFLLQKIVLARLLGRLDRDLSMTIDLDRLLAVSGWSFYTACNLFRKTFILLEQT